MPILPITLTMAAAAALINIWLMVRVGKVRNAEKVFVGDEGNETVIRRMRAHSNFIESAPLVLILIAALELAGWGGMWLWVVGYTYVAGRILHGLGMDGGSFKWGRFVGTIITLLTLAGLALTGIYVAWSVM